MILNNGRNPKDIDSTLTRICSKGKDAKEKQCFSGAQIVYHKALTDNTVNRSEFDETRIWLFTPEKLMAKK